MSSHQSFLSDVEEMKKHARQLEEQAQQLEDQAQQLRDKAQQFRDQARKIQDQVGHLKERENQLFLDAKCLMIESKLAADATPIQSSIATPMIGSILSPQESEIINPSIIAIQKLLKDPGNIYDDVLDILRDHLPAFHYIIDENPHSAYACDNDNDEIDAKFFENIPDIINKLIEIIQNEIGEISQEFRDYIFEELSIFLSELYNHDSFIVKDGKDCNQRETIIKFIQKILLIISS